MRKNALLIAPYIHDFAAFDLWLKPLGLLYVASAAERAGYGVRVVNCLDRLYADSRASSSQGSSPSRQAARVGAGKLPFEIIDAPAVLAGIPRRYRRYGIPLDAFEKALADGPRPDVIGVGSMMTYWYGGVAETISIARAVWPGVPVVLGGVYATLCPEHARAHSGADVVVEGPGEEEFLEFVRAKIGPGGGDRDDSAPVRPGYHLLGAIDSVSMLTSFGCPFSCSYCASRLLRQGYHQRPVAEVVDEMAYYAQEMNIRDIAFYDDALLVNADRHIKPILREVIERGLGVRLHTPNGLHANMVDRELAGLMRESGFATVRLSVESVDETRLKDSCMKVSMKGFEEAMKFLFEAGYSHGEIEAYVMMGAPGQPPEEVERTIRFAHGTGALVRLADFSPIPGTPYFDAAMETYGLDPAEPLMHNSSALPHLVPGLHNQYQALKDLAGALNSDLRKRSA